MPFTIVKGGEKKTNCSSSIECFRPENEIFKERVKDKLRPESVIDQFSDVPVSLDHW